MIVAEQKFSSIQQIQDAIHSGDETASSIATAYLDAARHFNPQLNAFTTLNAQMKIEANALDALDPSARGVLHGIPIAIKDSIETRGIATSFGSASCRGYVPKEDAKVVRRLKAAGALIVGKTTLPDFCTSFFSTSSLSEVSKNPFDPTRDTGGSSSGSSSAVAAQTAIASIGTDTAGSIRVPASWNGLVGVRLTPGRISRHGMSPLLHAQDTPGPLAHSVEDCARILDVIVGYDEKDPSSAISHVYPLRGTFLQAIQNPSLQGRRIGAVRGLFGTHPGILDLVNAQLKQLTAGGAVLIDIELPDLDTYLARTFNYDQSKSLINNFLKSRLELAGLQLGSMPHHKLCHPLEQIVAAPDDPTTSQAFCAAQLVRVDFQNAVASVFARHSLDTLLYPTTQILPPKHEDLYSQKITTLKIPVNTLIAAQLAWPALTVPVGFTREDADERSPALPVGIELLGMPFREEALMALGAGVEYVLGARLQSGSLALYK